jgi:hypothetical protein
MHASADLPGETSRLHAAERCTDRLHTSPLQVPGPKGGSRMAAGRRSGCNALHAGRQSKARCALWAWSFSNELILFHVLTTPP